MHHALTRTTITFIQHTVVWALEALLLASGLDDVRRAEAAPVILERLSLPPSPERGRTRLAPATTGWAQTERS